MTHKNTQSVREEWVEKAASYFRPTVGKARARVAMRDILTLQAAAILAEMEELPAKTIHGDISRKEARSIVKKHLL